MEASADRPWVEITSLLAQRDEAGLVALFDGISPMETAHAIARLDEDERNLLMEVLSPEEAADVLVDLPDEQAADIIEDIGAEEAAAIVEELPGDELADILGEVEEEEAEAILAAMEAHDPEEALAARTLLDYGEETAGGIMVTEFVSYHQDQTVTEVLADLRSHRRTYSDFDVQYAYITSREGELRGILKMRDVLLSLPETRVGTLMLKEILHVPVDRELDDLVDIFEEHAYIGVPVVNEASKLVGVVRRAAVMEASGKRSKDTYLKASGIVGGEELRSMPLLSRVSKRLAWLLPSMLLLVMASVVIVHNEEIIRRHAILAAFLTIVAGLSGNSGNQAMAVSIRELALGLIRPSEAFLVFVKEAGLGLLVGLLLGSLLGIAATLFTGDIRLGCVVAIALGTNTFFAVVVGGIIPLGLRGIGLDPALASGPILTTSVDMFGFFLVLSLAHLLLP